MELSTRNQVDEVAPAFRVIQQARVTRLERGPAGSGHPIAGTIATTNDSTIVTTTSQMKTFTHVF